MDITYHELFIIANNYKNELEKNNVKAGEIVLLQTVNPLNTLIAFWGNVLNGSVPAMFPISADMPVHIKNIDNLCKSFDISYMICDEPLHEVMKNKISYVKNLAVTCDKEVHKFDTETDDTDDDKTAMLQFSSGSTGTPKGVMLSHKNIISNITDISIAVGLKNDDMVYNWLPLSHDFGLLATHMSSLLARANQILMAPTNFLRNPAIWCEIVSKYGVTLCSLPNFAMNLIVKYYKKNENIDLSTMRVIATAGEGISGNTCRKFIKTLSGNGLKDDTIFAAYGLAEATAAVTIYKIDINADKKIYNDVMIGQLVTEKVNDNEKSVVSCGKKLSCNNVFICDDDGNVLDENIIGNIIVEGENISAGYYKNESATNATIIDGKLQTGDIGFISGNELYVTGRKKEIIIINGKNFFASDIESVIYSKVESLRNYVIAAFKVQKNDKEHLYVAVESDEKMDIEIAKKIKSSVINTFHVQVDEVVFVPALPRTASGKIQYYKLSHKYEQSDIDGTYSVGGILQKLILIVERINEEKIDESDIDKPFTELGIDSLKTEMLFGELELEFGFSVTMDVIWNYPTLKNLADYIASNINTTHEAGKNEPEDSAENEDIAIISMACHFPGGADTPVQYWKNMISEKNCICKIDEERLRHQKDDELKKYKGGYLRNIANINAKKFGLAPVEIKKMDPQQKLLLRTMDELLVNASYSKEKISGTDTGVFIGISNCDYALTRTDDLDSIYDSTGNAFSIAANRISYLYNLEGPSMSVDTACSSSLVSVHMAAQAIRNNECNMAVCGGVNIILNPKTSEVFFDAKMLSPDSKCKTFDESANGYVRGEGVGLVLLKRLKDAVRDGDNIYAVIKGSAINQDGKSNGLTAPNGRSQKKVIEKALKNAKLSVNEIDYIESHGTGTKLGDPIEFNTLNSIMKERTASDVCYVGSVKTNIGHLEAAAGIASLIKAVLILNNDEIPAILNFTKINPYIEIDESKIRIASESMNKTVKNVGISSFGFGGTNCHMIVSECEKKDISGLNYVCQADEVYWHDIEQKEAANGNNIRQMVYNALSNVTAYSMSDLKPEDKLQDDLGIDSIMMIQLADELTAKLELEGDKAAKIIAVGCEDDASIKDLCDAIEKAGVVVQADEYEDEFDSDVNIESKIEDFDEVKQLKARMSEIEHNPYYKVNYGIPKDVIMTDEGEKINYSTYNYVGLNGDPDIINASVEAMKKYGTSVSGSRMISGEISLHRELEEKITSFLGTEDTIVYIGGYTTNVSAISTIVSSEDLILHDALSHNSIITGCVLSGAKRIAFKHNDMVSLESSLKKLRKTYRRVLIVAEGIYSMDGDICDLPKLIQLKKKYGALLMIDEAHSLGTIGEQGRGVGSYYNVDRKDVDLWMGTMSKSLASFGGNISGSKALVELLKYSSDGFMFSVGISPANAAAALQALIKLEKSKDLVERLKENSEYFLSLMKEAGFDTGLAVGTAIVPCILGDSKKCMEVSDKLYENGINVMPIIYPAVPEKEARLRFFLSTNHTKDEMRYTVETLKRIIN